MTLKRFMLPRVAHCNGGALPAMHGASTNNGPSYYEDLNHAPEYLNGLSAPRR